MSVTEVTQITGAATADREFKIHVMGSYYLQLTFYSSLLLMEGGASVATWLMPTVCSANISINNQNFLTTKNCRWLLLNIKKNLHAPRILAHVDLISIVQLYCS